MIIVEANDLAHVYPIIIAVSPFTNYKITKTTLAKTPFCLTSFYVALT